MEMNNVRLMDSSKTHSIRIPPSIHKRHESCYKSPNLKVVHFTVVDLSILLGACRLELHFNS